MVLTRHKPTEELETKPSGATAKIEAEAAPNTSSDQHGLDPTLTVIAADVVANSSSAIGATDDGVASAGSGSTAEAGDVVPTTAVDALAASTSSSIEAAAEAMEPAAAKTEEEELLNAKGPGGGPAKKMRRSKKEFTWLTVIGGPCHSERQVLSGVDLTDLKRKYKLMKCSVCEMYNPSTPWALPRPRKYEYDTFADHEKSVHHVKAVANQELTDPSSVTVSIVTDHAAALAAFKAMNGSLGKDADSDEDDINRRMAGQDGGMVTAINAAAAAVAAPGNVIDISSKRRRKRSRKEMLAVPKIPTTKGLIKPALMQPKRVATKGHLRPAWLVTDGELRLSEKQYSDPQLHNAKKKYRNVMCAICRDFNPASHWAQWKARKYESTLLLEHEKSAVHQKALELQQAAHSGAMEVGAAQIPDEVNVSHTIEQQSAVPVAPPAASAEDSTAAGLSEGHVMPM